VRLYSGFDQATGDLSHNNTLMGYQKMTVQELIQEPEIPNRCGRMEPYTTIFASMCNGLQKGSARGRELLKDAEGRQADLKISYVSNLNFFTA